MSTSGGGTSWLTSQAPVAAGEVISLEFLIWDTGDESYDSSVLLDNFTWSPRSAAPRAGHRPVAAAAAARRRRSEPRRALSRRRHDTSDRSPERLAVRRFS